MRGNKTAKNARHAMRQPKASKPKSTPANDPSLPDLEKKTSNHKVVSPPLQRHVFPYARVRLGKGEELVIPPKSSSNAPSLCFPSIVTLLRVKSRHYHNLSLSPRMHSPLTRFSFPEKFEDISLFHP